MTHLVDGLALGLVLGVALLLVRLLALRLCHLLKKIGSKTLIHLIVWLMIFLQTTVDNSYNFVTLMMKDCTASATRSDIEVLFISI